MFQFGYILMALQVKWSDYNSLTQSNIDIVKEEAGIYKLSSEDTKDTTKVNVFYVGQAKKLKERLSQHLSKEEENDCIKNKVAKLSCSFKFAYVSKQEDRDCMESFLYDHYKPECNKQKPNSKPCEINLN